MLIVPSRKAIVLKASDPDMLTTLLPSARKFNYKGKELVAMPHVLDNVKVLRNLGAEAPSPINFYYEYPKAEGRYSPFAHQKKTAEFLTLHQRLIVLNEPRTGKTLSCLWAHDYLANEGHIKGPVVIVAPLSTLDDVWYSAVFKTFWWRKGVVLHGSRDRRIKLMQQSVDYYIINHHGLDVVGPEIAKLNPGLIIYDEAAICRNAKAGFYQALDRLLNRCPNARLWLLTGTPTPNAPTDAWALCKLLRAEVPRFTLFREMTMRKISDYTWIPREDAMQTVSKYLWPAIRFKRDECFDVVEPLYELRRCELSVSQRKAYLEMKKTMIAEVGSASITAVNDAAKRIKLLQIVLGVVIDDEGNEACVGCEERVSVIKEVIEEAGGKVLVFVPFTAPLHYIAGKLAEDYSVAVVNGAVSLNARREIFSAFRQPAGPRVIVADARVMAHGLDLTSADTIVWASAVDSNEVFEQACARVEGPRQTKATSIVCIESTPEERAIYSRLREKKSLQGVLLDLVKQRSEGA